MNQPEFTESQIQSFFDEHASMNVLKDFNGRHQKPLLSKTKMTVGVTYPILRAQRKKTKIGDSIALELEQYILCLVERYTSLPDETIAALSEMKFSVIKRNDGKLYLELNKTNQNL
ncbi:hypothetical protein ACLKA7_005020 [Drosophila subpalustris]